MQPRNQVPLQKQATWFVRRPKGRMWVGLALLIPSVAAVGLLSGGCPDDFFPGTDSGRDLTPVARLAVSPARGLILGGTRVTIVGSDAPAFGAGTEVLFGGLTAANIEVVDDATVLATTPRQAGGPVDVSVRVSKEETVTESLAFEYVTIEDAGPELLGDVETMFPGQPSVVSAVATGNTSVRVTFSEPVRNDATEPSNYSIVAAGGGVLVVDRSRPPTQSEDHTVVDLFTLSQSGTLYQLTATGIHDLAGNPIAPPDIMVNPSEATFTGIPPAMEEEQIDTDGDGLADWFEMAGWQVTVERSDGLRVQSHVTSDPFNPDTDGDSVSDLAEMVRATDPRSSDTDADLVSDAAEINDWLSNPCDQDSDDDGLSDSMELRFRTSPILADTDGDQLSDADELFQRNRNPLVADLPTLVVTVGEIDLRLDQRYTYTDQFGQERQLQESCSSTVQRDTSSSVSNTSSDTLAYHVGAKAGFKAGGEYGSKEWKISGELSGEVSGGFSRETTSGITRQSSQQASRAYNEAVNRVSQFSSISGITRETVGARLAGAVTVGAASDIAFQVSNLELSVLLQDPRDRSRLLPIATLAPDKPDAAYSVGPLAPQVGPLVFQNTSIFPNMVEELMKDPQALLFKVANFDITDELGRNFAFASQEVTERTATVTIDYGNGQSETHRVATAGQFDPQGRSLGISMADAMRAISLSAWPDEDVELGSTDDPADARPKPSDPAIQSSFGMRTVAGVDAAGQPVDVRVITRVRGVQDDFDRATVEPNKPNDGAFWATFVSAPGGQGASGSLVRLGTHFDEARLHAGEMYFLAFVKDTDRDGLTSLEEFFSGSSDDRPDSDRDGLGDYLETRGQWNDAGLGSWLVHTDRKPGGYRAYSASDLSDSDEDGLSDDREYALCGYRYNPDGTAPATAFAIGTYDDGLTNPGDAQVTWSNGVRPADLPFAFPPADGLAVNWHEQLDPATGTPETFPSNRASLDPRKMDTDEDGITDADEVNGYYLDLFDQDPTDGIRTRVFVHSDPLHSDTDRDGLPDGMERQFGTNPVSADSGTIFDDDLDGLPNRVEETGWLVTIDGVERRVFSNPADPDSDSDDLPDYVEWVLGTSPWYYDGQTVDPNLPAPGYDTDADGLGDREEWDGTVPPQKRARLAFCGQIPNCADYTAGSEPTRTDPTLADSDGDGLNDGIELTGRLVQVAGEAAYLVASDPLVFDSDQDGLSDGEEQTLGTDPTKADTDGDTTLDLVERDQADDQGKHRNPLARDQRVTISWDGFGIHLAPGSTNPPAAMLFFGFDLGIWRLAVMPPVIHWAGTAQAVSGVPACTNWYEPSICTAGCAVGGATKLFLWDDWHTFGDGLKKSFVMSYGDEFYVHGDLEAFMSFSPVSVDCTQALGFELKSDEPYAVPLEGTIQYFELKYQFDPAEEDKFYFLGRILLD